jgi:ribosomal protein L11 methylase PrmA
MGETATTRERIDFGPLIGELELRQVSGADFHSLCLSKNSHDRDSTGLRMHAGAHLTTRMLLLLSSLVEGKNWIEVGCGTGVVSLAGKGR